MATKNPKILAAKKIAAKSKAKAKPRKKDYSPQNAPQSKRYKEKNDLKKPAKPVGARWTNAGAKKIGKDPYKKPSNKEVEQYKGETFKDKKGTHRYIYDENRVDKSDISIKNKLEDGGTTGAGTFSKGGRVANMDYSELNEYIKDTYANHIKNASFTFYISETGDVIDYVGKSIKDQHRLIFEDNADFTEENFEKNSGGYTIKDFDTIVSPDGEELEEVESGNTYNQSYLGGADFNYRIYEDKNADKYFLVALLHGGGDIRVGYTQAFIFEADSQEKAIFKFLYLINGFAQISIEFDDNTTANFDSQQDSDVWYFEAHYEHTDNKGLAKKFVKDFESFGSWKGDDFLENTVEIANEGQRVRFYKRGGATFSGRQYTPYREDIDLEKTAKPAGYRYTDALAKRLKVSPYARPTKEHIEKYLGRGVYFERREDKSDLKPTTSKTKASLEDGGTTGAGSFKRGGKTKYRPQYVHNEDIASITLKSGKVITNDYIYDGAYVSKSLKLEDGGTTGAGSFKRGGKTKYRPQYVHNEDIASITLKSGKVITNDYIYDGAYVSKSLKLEDGGTTGADSFARGGVERIVNMEAKSYTENLIPFKASNLEGKTLDNGDYVVLSYGHYPLWWFCKKEGKWYGNSTKYSITTSKQLSQSRPTYDATMLSRNDLTDMMMKQSASFEEGGLLDNILSDTSVDATQIIGGTTFSQADLTPQMDITNPNF